MHILPFVLDFNANFTYRSIELTYVSSLSLVFHITGTHFLGTAWFEATLAARRDSWRKHNRCTIYEEDWYSSLPHCASSKLCWGQLLARRSIVASFNMQVNIQPDHVHFLKIWDNQGFETAVYRPLEFKLHSFFEWFQQALFHTGVGKFWEWIVDDYCWCLSSFLLGCM